MLKSCFGYLKTMLEPKSDVRLPGSVYERCVDPASSGALAACGLHNVLRSILNVVDADAPAFYFDVDACVVLGVLSNFQNAERMLRSITLAKARVVLQWRCAT